MKKGVSVVRTIILLLVLIVLAVYFITRFNQLLWVELGLNISALVTWFVKE